MGSGVNWALWKPPISRFLPFLPQYRGNQLHRKHWRGCFLRSVHLFGSVSPKAFSAQGMLPMFWTGYCGSYSWWASVICSHSQGSGPDDFSPRCLCLRSLLHRCSGETPAPRFPWESWAAIPDFPIHTVNQEICNYGALEIAESCAEFSSEGAFPTSGFSV